MGNMFDQFETDKDLEVDGIWIDYGDFRVKIGRAGGANKRYLSYADTKTKPFRRAIAAGTMPEERSRGLLYDIFAKTIVLDWQVADGVNEDTGEMIWKQGIHKKDGGTLDFSYENVLLTFKLLPAIFFDIQQAAESIALFRKEEMEADGKNS